jgi:hypothetical protein
MSKRRRGEVEDYDLRNALESSITSQGSAELAVLFLIENYDFSLDAVKSRLQDSFRSPLVTPTQVSIIALQGLQIKFLT